MVKIDEGSLLGCALGTLLGFVVGSFDGNDEASLLGCRPLCNLGLVDGSIVKENILLFCGNSTFNNGNENTLLCFILGTILGTGDGLAFTIVGSFDRSAVGTFDDCIADGSLFLFSNNFLISLDFFSDIISFFSFFCNFKYCCGH